VGPGQCKKFPFEWDPRANYDDLEHSIFEKMLTCGTLENFMTTWNTLLSKNAYMWDLTKFYDDLECSIFKIMLTCGTKVGL
jgi:hypothetical protein